jgi:lysophospholipase L1-like esterase
MYSALITFVLVLLAEGAAQLCLWKMYRGRLQPWERLHEYDSLLGWRNLKSHRVPNRYGPGNNATHNIEGFRAEIEFTRGAAPGRYRILFLGDSFTYGVDADDKDTFPSQMETLCPAIEAVNMGVAGYGIDQCYLRYQAQGAELDANLVVLAFIENDFARMSMSVFQTSYPKPQLILDGGAIKTVNVPVPAWGDPACTGWLEEFPNRLGLVRLLRKVSDTYINNYPVFPMAERVFNAMNAQCRSAKREFVLVYLPSKTDFHKQASTEAERKAGEIAARLHIPFINLTGAFRGRAHEQIAGLFRPDGDHYSKPGYRLVAEELLKGLRRELPDVPR